MYFNCKGFRKRSFISDKAAFNFREHLVDLTRFFPGFDYNNELTDDGADFLEQSGGELVWISVLWRQKRIKSNIIQFWHYIFQFRKYEFIPKGRDEIRLLFFSVRHYVLVCDTLKKCLHYKNLFSVLKSKN